MILSYYMITIPAIKESTITAEYFRGRFSVEKFDINNFTFNSFIKK